MVIDDLIEIAEKERASQKKYVVRCCMAAGCMSSDSKGVKEGLERRSRKRGWPTEVEVRGVGCMKLCCQGPLVQIDSRPRPRAPPCDQTAGPGPLYLEGQARKMPHRSSASIKGGQTPVQRGDPNHPFFTGQKLHRPRQQRLRRPGTHRVLHRGRRLPGRFTTSCAR